MHKLFFLSYFALSIFIYFLALLLLPLLMLRKKHRQSLAARLLPFCSRLFGAKRVQFKTRHFHGASYGEISALSAFAEREDSISAVTKTGFELAKSKNENAFYLPYEPLLLFYKMPRSLLLFEAELWPFLIFWAKCRKARVLLINARVSKKSFARYKAFLFLYKRVFANIDLVVSQSQRDATRLRHLGAKNIHAGVNIKALSKAKASKDLPRPDREIILLASTHEAEEELILDALKLKEKEQLIVAPRHPERFSEVYALLQGRFGPENCTRFSEDEKGYLKSKIFLLDTLGELVNFYAISPCVVLGGSFVPVGGHDFAQPASFACKIISGPHVFRQRALLELVQNVYFAGPGEDLDFSKVNKSSLTIADDFLKELLKEEHARSL